MRKTNVGSCSTVRSRPSATDWQSSRSVTAPGGPTTRKSGSPGRHVVADLGHQFDRAIRPLGEGGQPAHVEGQDDAVRRAGHERSLSGRPGSTKSAAPVSASRRRRTAADRRSRSTSRPSRPTVRNVPLGRSVLPTWSIRIEKQAQARQAAIGRQLGGQRAAPCPPTRIKYGKAEREGEHEDRQRQPGDAGAEHDADDPRRELGAGELNDDQQRRRYEDDEREHRRGQRPEDGPGRVRVERRFPTQRPVERHQRPDGGQRRRPSRSRARTRSSSGRNAGLDIAGARS